MSWGGARKGAGRPARGPVPSEPHKTRPHLAPRHPVLVTARLVELRSRERHASVSRADLYRSVRRALAVSLARTDFRVVRWAARHDRLELVVEADDRLALARGMQGFQVSAAKSLNRLAGRRGTVFRDRYRMRILKTRLEVRDVVGRLPAIHRAAWPETWLLRIELSRATRWPSRHATRAPP